MSRKSSSPIDRAVADLEQQIADLEQQAQQKEQPASRAAAQSGNWKEWFAPPPRRMAVATRRAPTEIPVEPLKELERTSSYPFEQQPDLFNRSTDKLAQYLSTGPLGKRPPLRHVQRQNRKKFYIGLALGAIVLVLLWLVVH